MAEQKNDPFAPLNYLIDSFWASLPEETATDLATFKKDVLGGVKNIVGSLIDQEIQWTDRHLENARKMRQQYQETTEPSATESPSS